MLSCGVRYENNTPPDIILSEGALNVNVYLDMFLFSGLGTYFTSIV
jgi:hypothetical protein